MKTYKVLGGILAALGLSLLWSQPAQAAPRTRASAPPQAECEFARPGVVPSRYDDLDPRIRSSAAHWRRGHR
jgi:hypothetical protein